MTDPAPKPGDDQPLSMQARIEGAADRYTPSERRIADYILRSYPEVAFVTASTLARATDTSAPTIVRFAKTIGFSGFSELQQNIRMAMEGDWSRVLDRLEGRPHVGADARWHARSLRADSESLRRSYYNVTPDTFDRVAELLADVERPLFLAGGEITRGICISFAALLSWLRDDVTVFEHSSVPFPIQVAGLPAEAVVFAMHLRRTTRSTNFLIETACERGASVVVATNSPTLAIPAGVDSVLVMNLNGAGDVLDSYTALASITNGLAATVAELLRPRLRERFDRLEVAWSALGVYSE